MKKSDFITLVFGTVGGLVFALGMCMCLLPEWGLVAQGRPVTAVGVVALIAAAVYHRKASGKQVRLPSAKVVGSVVLGVVGALVLGAGMCMVMVWNMMIPGILVGIVGIVLLLCLIPLCVGLK